MKLDIELLMLIIMILILVLFPNVEINLDKSFKTKEDLLDSESTVEEIQETESKTSFDQNKKVLGLQLKKSINPGRGTCAPVSSQDGLVIHRNNFQREISYCG